MNSIFFSLSKRYWMESKTRFILSLILVTLIILFALEHAEAVIKGHPSLHAGRRITFSQYVWVIIYKGDFLTLYTLSAFLFGVGGPLQEKATGTAYFTLSLPIYRSVLVRAKLFTASIQVMLLSVFSMIIIPFVSFLFHFHYPLWDAFLFGLLLMGGGWIFIVFAFMLSLFFQKYTVIIPLGIALLAIVFFITKLPAFEEMNIFNFMVGAGYLSNETFLFMRPINFLGLSLITLCLAILCGSLEIIFNRIDL